MFKKSLSDIPSFIAGDKTIIKEFVHPKNDAVDVNYSLAHAVVEVGKASEPHILTKSSELYVILSGEGELFVEKEAVILRGGETALVPAGATQWIRNVGDVPLAFYVIVSPPWDEGQEVVFPPDPEGEFYD
jgi:mannose-6-phosphate isomerase-like protein (cupin superfamily)